MGHVFPGACVPFGMVQLSPDTDTIPYAVNGKYTGTVYRYCAGYQHSDKTIVGFTHTHLSGTGHSDLSDFLIMPTVGKVQLNPGTADKPESGYRSRFSHETEKAEPGYYKVIARRRSYQCRNDHYGRMSDFTSTLSQKATMPTSFLILITGSTTTMGKYFGRMFALKTIPWLPDTESPVAGLVQITCILRWFSQNQSKTMAAVTMKILFTKASGVNSIKNTTSRKWQEKT